jgi:hypothetical protein
MKQQALLTATWQLTAYPLIGGKMIDYDYDYDLSDELAEDARVAVLSASSHKHPLPTPLKGGIETLGDLALDLACTSTADGDLVGAYLTPDAWTDRNTSLVLLDTALWLSPEIRNAIARFAYTCTYSQTSES